MSSPWVLLALALFLVVAEFLFIRLAQRYGLYDTANTRSSHTGAVVRGGGIVFYLAALAYFAITLNYALFFIGLTIISAIGFWDDIRSLSPVIRINVQGLATVLLLFATGFPPHIWWIFIIVGIINAYNFMDGVNGITAGYSLVALLTLHFANSQAAFIDSSLLEYCIVGILVFSLFNVRKRAKCFAGDVGSNSIAYIIVFALASLILKSHDWTWIVILNLYGVDSGMTILYRIKRRAKLSTAHREHVYQLMANELQMGHLAVSGIYVVIQAAINIGYLAVPTPAKAPYSIGITLLLATAYILIKRKYGHLLQTAK